MRSFFRNMRNLCHRTVNALRRIRKSPLVKEVPKFKRKIEHGSYSFSVCKSWSYKDKRHPVLNALTKYDSLQPHLVLRDGKGVPRFTLAFSEDAASIEITAIQRERTKYRKLKYENTTYFSWDSDAETRAAKQFQQQLGMHPAEFLLSEFLYRYRAKIRRGTKVYLKIIEGIDDANIRALYMPLVERFFKKAKDPNVFELNQNKKRVQEILAIE